MLASVSSLCAGSSCERETKSRFPTFRSLAVVPAALLLCILALQPLLVALGRLPNSPLLPDVYGTSAEAAHSAISTASNALVVVAHPDDEALFLSPTLTSLRSRGVRTFILSLSSGDHYNLGSIRRGELAGSCSALGAIGCAVLDDAELRDDPRAWWSDEAIAARVGEAIDRWHVDLIVTFDELGVTGHANHRAVGEALASAAARRPSFPPVFALRTARFARYGGLSLFELVPSLFGFLGSSGQDDALIVASWSGVAAGRRAFRSHRSQARGWESFLWRGPYTFVNHLERRGGLGPVARSNLSHPFLAFGTPDSYLAHDAL